MHFELKITIFSCFTLLSVFASGEPQDWFKSSGTPTFNCDIGKDNDTYEWFQVVFGHVVFSIQPSDARYLVNNSYLVVKTDFRSDCDFFCEARASDGRRWRSRKAQLRYGLESRGPSTSLSLTRSDTPETMRLFDGDSCHLTCDFSGKRQVQWLHNGSPISKSDKLRPVDSMEGRTVLYILRFNNTFHSGVYQCVIESDAWSPLRMPFLSNPSEKSTFRPDLQFLDYEILTASEITLNEDNKYPPRITPVRGFNFEVKAIGKETVQLTEVVVSDLDRGRGGYIQCNVSCQNEPCPTFESSVRRSPFIGSLKVKEWDGSQLQFDLICRDNGKQPKTTTESFIVDFNEVHDTEWKPVSKWTQKLITLRAKSLKEKDIHETLTFVEELTDATHNVSGFSEVDIALASAKTAEVMEALTEKKAKKDTMIKTVTTLVSNTMKADEKTMAKSETVADVASQTLSIVAQLAAAIPVNKNRSKKSFASDKLAVGAVALGDQKALEVAFSSPNGSPKQAAITNSPKEPRVAISLLADQVMSDRVDFVMYGDARLFQAVARSNRTRALSAVIAARAVLKQGSRRRQAPVRLFFNADNLPDGLDDNAARFCAFWNTNNRTWDTEGCQSFFLGRSTLCNCSHLTSFALLLDLDAKPVSRQHYVALSVLSYFCLTLSCAALAFTIFVYFTYMRCKQASGRSGHKTAASAVARSRIMMALSGSLLTAHLVFLVTAFHSYAGPGCKAIAMLLHFFYLSVFFWSVMEGVNLFLSVVHMALNSGRLVLNIAKFFPKAAACAWSFSAIIVVITAASSRLAAYGPLYEGVEDASDMSLCFLADVLAFNLSFVLPMTVCLTVNIVILVLLAFVLMRRSGGLSEKKKSRSRNKVIGFLSVCVTLNVTWVIGLLQFGPGKVVINYLFVICNGLQGVFIFSCYCLLREEMRTHMARSVWCLSVIGRRRRRSETTCTSIDQTKFTSGSSSQTESSRKLVSSKVKKTRNRDSWSDAKPDSQFLGSESQV